MSLTSDVETLHIEENKSVQEGSEMRSNIEQKLIDHLFHNELHLFKQSLEALKEPPIDIIAIHDKKHYNFLHMVALNNQSEMVKYLYEQARNYEKKSDFQRRITEWTNEKTEEGFTPLHLAAFRGNLKIMELLVKNGADVSIENKQGLNCLHIAAQGDQAPSLIYFKEKGLDINKTDLKGSTPLHWASYLGCENAVNFLISWNPKLDMKDEEGGLTPLHLAVISGNSRVVRKLLIKGCNRSVKDKNNKTPADLAKENDYLNILGMLEETNKCQKFFNIKTSFKPTKKKISSLLGFFMFFFIFNPLIILFTFPYINNVSWIVIFLTMMILSLLFFLISWIANPGYLYKKPGSTLLKIIEKGNDCTGICPECEIVKPLRSRHCDVCNRCVGVYDHHCPWINNCVGMKNHKYFLAFISSVWIYLLFTILMISINLQYNDISGTYMENWAKIDNKNFLIAKLTCNIASLCVAIFFFVPLSILVYIQIINFFLNKTTAERYGHNTQKNDSRISVQVKENTKKILNILDRILLSIIKAYWKYRRANQESQIALKKTNNP